MKVRAWMLVAMVTLSACAEAAPDAAPAATTSAATVLTNDLAGISFEVHREPG
jgi:hypothetical protein